MNKYPVNDPQVSLPPHIISSSTFSSCTCSSSSLPAMDPTLKPILVLVTLFLSSLSQAGAGGGFRPVGGAEYRVVKGLGLGAQKVSEPFQMCLACKCCASGSAADCASMPCCFGINCNLPDKPYGVCAFVPMFCNCSSCAA